jgi:hypothetical protein
MCSYTYIQYYCGCDYYMISDSVEFCSNRIFSGYSVDGWSNDMCEKQAVSFAGISRFYCNECSEDHTLEYQLEEQ